MVVEKLMENDVLTLSLNGRLDTTTASLVEDEIQALPIEVKHVVLDLANLEYVSSAGLRVILKLKKVMDRIGSLKVINVNELVLEVFEITGFADILGL